jgi:hypothetical protein
MLLLLQLLLLLEMKLLFGAGGAETDGARKAIVCEKGVAIGREHALVEKMHAVCVVIEQCSRWIEH